MQPKTQYITIMVFALFLIMSPFIILQVWPGSTGMDAPQPEYWSFISKLVIIMLFSGSLILVVTGLIGYIYQDKLWDSKIFLRYQLPVVLGFPITAFFIAVFIFELSW